ncbi:ejaculatory bulb-specific protein 3-like [Vespa crabro]|uniref:ejaculatory bulb-specific protein 3-like n=1 Tax=Vespa crabro TaxID=7445 RepID=UPI001F024AED|nr:ejaculatory bulb-specific protein 3-like [Vespa crabro]
MMKLLQYVSLVSLLVVFAFVKADDELYSDKYDYIDPKEIVANDRLRDEYYNCFMDINPCVTPDAIFFKSNLPEAIITKCKKCTEKQKENFEFIAVWYTDNRPDEWNALIKKFMEDAKKQNIDNSK